MKEDTAIRFNYLGTEINSVGDTVIIVKINRATYRSMRDHLINSVENYHNFYQIADGVTLKQTLEDCWEKAIHTHDDED